MTTTAKWAQCWHLCADSRHPPHLLSTCAVGSATAADGVVYTPHRAGGEWCMHQRYIFGRLVLCCGFWTANCCNKDDPRRLIKGVCAVWAPVGGIFGLALVWERGGQEDRDDFFAMVDWFLGLNRFEVGNTWRDKITCILCDMTVVSIVAKKGRMVKLSRICNPCCRTTSESVHVTAVRDTCNWDY